MQACRVWFAMFAFCPGQSILKQLAESVTVTGAEATSPLLPPGSWAGALQEFHLLWKIIQQYKICRAKSITGLSQ